MIINFRQGIVDYDTTALPFLAAGINVSLVVGTRPITVTIAQAANNYTFQETTTVNNAWTVPNASGTYWLYLNYNSQTLVRTFGYTTLQPYAQITAPANPAIGQMWYNTSTFRNYEWTSGGWTEVLRVFACKFIGNVAPPFRFVSMGDHPPLPSGFADFRGTQIGVNQVNVASGFPLYDFNGVVIRQSTGTFLTTENEMFAQGASITGLRLESNVYNAFSSDVTTIPAYAIVAAQPNGSFQLATYNNSLNTLIALAIQNITAGGTGSVALEGTITNPLWNWTNYVGQLLWVSGANAGQLQTTDPHLDNPIAYPVAGVPVARVVSPNTILFLQGIGTKGPPGTSGSGAGVVPATTTVQGVVYLSTNSGTYVPTTNIVVEQGDPRLTNARPPLAHNQAATTITVAPDAPSGVTQANVQLALQALGLNKLNLAGGTMTGNLILNGNPAAAFQAATKQYVDLAATAVSSNAVQISGSTMTGALILNANPAVALQAATKQYVDSVASGLSVQAPARVATTGNLTGIYAGSPNYTLTEIGNGALVIDGVSLALNDRVLVKDQTPATANGIYTVTDAGSVGTPWVLTRDNLVYVSGTFIFVQFGTANTGSSWVLTTPNPIVLDVTPLTFVLFSSVAALTSGQVIAALGYTPTGPITVSGGTGLNVSGSPASGGAPSPIVLSLSTELLGLNALTGGGLGFVQRTGPGSYIAAALSGAQVTTALGYIPLASRTINTTAPLAGGGPLTGDLTLTIQSFATTAPNPGAVPLSPGGTTSFLRADGTWAVPPGGGGGGVSSVAASTTSTGLIISGTNPITSAGTLIFNLNAELQGLAALGTVGVVQRTGAGIYTAAALSSGDITTALGYTPYDATNPSGYISGNQNITLSGDITGAGTTAITTTLSNTGVVASTYNNVTVDAKGRVSAGSNVAYLTANQNITVTGDATGSGTTSIALTLAATGVPASTYNNVTVDTKGRVTAGSNAAYITGNQNITITGDTTGSGTTAITTTLSNTGVSAGTYGDALNIPVVTVDTKGRLTTVTTAPITITGLPSQTGNADKYLQTNGTTASWSFGVNCDIIFATASQTVFTTTTVSTIAKTGFPNGKASIQVFMNGVQQREDNSSGTGFSPNSTGQFYVSGANQITFFSALSATDEVTVYQL